MFTTGQIVKKSCIEVYTTGEIAVVETVLITRGGEWAAGTVTASTSPHPRIGATVSVHAREVSE